MKFNWMIAKFGNAKTVHIAQDDLYKLNIMQDKIQG